MTYQPQLRVVNHPEGASRLAALRESIDQFPARQQPGPSPLRDVTRPATHPVTADEALQNPDQVREGAAKGASYGQGDGGLEPPQNAPLCVIGAQIWLNHKLGADWRCERCGWDYPALTR